MKRLLTLIITLCCLLLPASAYAYNPLSNACGAGGGAGSSTACGASSSNPISGPNGVLKKITVIIASIAGIAAVIMIIVSGIRIITSNGDPQAMQAARLGIIHAAIGLAIIAAAGSIITLVVSKI